MVWLKSAAAKAFKVGDVVKEKSTGRAGIIQNHYSGRYIVEFEVDAGNPFKKDTTSIPEEDFSKNFSKGTGLSKSAADTIPNVEEEAGEMLESNKDKWAEETKKEAEEEKNRECVASIYKTAADFIHDATVHAIGPDNVESYMRGMFPAVSEGTVPPQEPTPEKIAARQEFTNKLWDASENVSRQLKAYINNNSSTSAGVEEPCKLTSQEAGWARGAIDRILNINITTRDISTKTAEISNYKTGNLAGLYSYFTNQWLRVLGTPLTAPRVFAIGSPEDLRGKGVVGPLTVKKEDEEALKSKEKSLIEQKQKGMREDIREDYKKDIADIFSSPEALEALAMKDTSSKIPVRKIAVYDVAIGDSILDKKYGKGTVTGIDNLEAGFVSAQFGANVRVDNYDAARIAAPYYTTIDEFQCPLDLTTLTAEACLGDVEGTACSFLRYINDEPTCMYAFEMKAMSDKHVNAKKENIKERVDTAVSKQLIRERAKKQLDKILTYSRFSDHDYHNNDADQRSPIVVTGSVLHKKSGLYGEVLEKNDDSSVLVRWADGYESVAWEIELSGMTKQAVMRLVVDKFLDISDDVKDIVLRKSAGKLTGDQFISEVKQLADRLNMAGLMEADLLGNFWTAARELGLSEHTPKEEEVPVYELAHSNVLEDVQQRYPEEGFSPATSLKVEADEKLEQDLATPVPQSESVSIPYTAINPKDPTSALDILIHDWKWVREKDGQFVVLDKNSLLVTKPDGTALTEPEWDIFIAPNRKNISALLTPPKEKKIEEPGIPEARAAALKE